MGLYPSNNLYPSDNLYPGSGVSAAVWADAQEVAEGFVDELPLLLRPEREMRAFMRCMARERQLLMEAASLVLDVATLSTMPPEAFPVLERLFTLAGVGSDEQRRAALLAAYRTLEGDGTGTAWTVAMAAILGDGWNYHTHEAANISSPAAHTIALRTAIFPGPGVFEELLREAYEVTPAHVGLTLTWTGGFIVGVSKISVDVL